MFNIIHVIINLGGFMYKSNINFNLYKTFYDVAIYGSISKAAVMNYTSQPAISRSIKQLEGELNTQLFFRNKKGIELTEKGKELFFFVEQSYNSLILAERSMLENKSLDNGKLSIGIPSHIATFYIFDAIDKFHKEYPSSEWDRWVGPTPSKTNINVFDENVKCFK